MAALPGLALHHFEANDARSAEKLLALAYLGLRAMPPSDQRDAIAALVKEVALCPRCGEASPVGARFCLNSETQLDQIKSRNSGRGEFIIKIVIGQDVDHFCCCAW
mgnify:CR=1 FL=1